MPVKHTVMREDLSWVNTRTFSTARTDATIRLALDAIGTDRAELMLADEDDGVWTISTDLTIPTNVFLRVPFGVTVIGPGDITILGGSLAMRWPWHQGPGTIIQQGATQPMTVASLYAGDSTVYYLDVLTEAHITGDLRVGRIIPDYTLPDGTGLDYKHTVVLDDTPTAGYLARTATGIVHDSVLTGDSENILYGLSASCLLTTNSYRLGSDTKPVGLSGFFSISEVRGLGGVVDIIHGIQAMVFNRSTGIVTHASSYTAHYPNLAPGQISGEIKHYYAYEGRDATGLVGTIFASIFYGNMSLNGTKHFNLYMVGNAPNYLAGSLTLSLSTTTSVYKLFVDGSAGTPGGVWVNTTSSQRLKDNIHDVSDALAQLLRLRGRGWDWNPQTTRDLAVPEGPQVGFVLEEVEAVRPAWVMTGEDGSKGLRELGALALVIEALRELDTRLKTVGA